MHIKIKSHSLILISIVTFRCQYKVGRELGIAPERTDTRNDVAKKGGVRVACELDWMMLEGWATRELVVDDVVELFRRLE